VADVKVRVPEMPHPPRFNTYSDFMAVTGFYRQEQLFAATLALAGLYLIYVNRI